MVATSLPGSDAEAAPPSVEAVREATRAVLPLVDLETVKEREVVAMVEQRLGAMVADTEPLRSAVQDEIDRCLLRDDELLVASGGPAPSTGGAAGAGSGGGPKKKAGPKRKRAGGLDGFVVDDDEDDEDYREEDEDEDEDEDDRGARVRPGAKQQAATAARRYTKAEWRAARHDWSAPAPNPDANVLNANVLNATAPPIAAITDEKVHAALSSVVLSGQNPTPATAKALASFLKAPKSDVNKALYRLEKAGKATKTTADGGAPVWTPVGTISDTRGGAETRDPSGPPARSSERATNDVPANASVPPGSANPPNPKPLPGRTEPTVNDGASFSLALSETRRVSVGEYRGRKHVSLREFYLKDGAWLPGKKGINLSVEQWRSLKTAAPRVTARLRSGETPTETDTVAELGGRRRVTCGAFRGAATVGVREYYEKNGEMLPGFRGLNMSAEQWDTLNAHIEAIDRAIDA